MSPGTKDPNKRGSRGLRGCPGIGRPGSPRGVSARGVGMTVSESCPPGPTSRAARSPGRGRARPPLQSLGGGLHYRGWNGGRARIRVRVPASSAGGGGGGWAATGPGRAGVVLAAAAARRQSRSFPGSGRRACLRACVCARARACAPTRMCPLHRHAPTYWPRRRREPWPPRMRSLTIDTRTVAPPPASQRGRAIRGQEAGQPPSLTLITQLP